MLNRFPRFSFFVLRCFVPFAFLFFALAGLPAKPTGNELSHIELLRSLVVAASVEIDPYVADSAIYNEKNYSNKPPGYPLAMWPLFKIYQFVMDLSNPGTTHFYLFSLLFNAAISTGVVALTFRYLSSFPLSRTARIFGTAAAGFGTLLPAYSALAISGPLSILLTAAALLLVRINETDASRPPGLLVLAAGAMAFAFIVDYKSAAFVLPLALIAGHRLLSGGVRPVLAAAGLATLPLAALAIYNLVAFDKILVLSYQHYDPYAYVPWTGLEGAISPAYIPEAAWGLTFGTARGMLPLSPVVALGLTGLVIALRAGHRSVRIPALMALSGFLFVCNYVYWFGGHSVGYRHVLTSAILLAMLSAFAVDKIGRRRLVLAGCGAVLAVSVAFSVTAWRIQQDPVLLDRTWLQEQGRKQGNFFTALLIPCLTDDDRCVKTSTSATAPRAPE